MYIRAVNYRDTGRGPIVPLQKRLRGDTEEGWGAQADQRPTCLGSQANHKENPTNGNYTGRILTNGNYSWKWIIPAQPDKKHREVGRGVNDPIP